MQAQRDQTFSTLSEIGIAGKLNQAMAAGRKKKAQKKASVEIHEIDDQVPFTMKKKEREGETGY